MRIIGISFDSAQLLFDCSCSPLSSTQRLYNTFKVRDAVFADRCEHALVFCIVHNIFSTRHFSAVSSQAQTQHEIILSERKFMSVFANEMWGLVLLEDVDRSMVRCVVCGRKHCSHTNLLSRSGLKHVARFHIIHVFFIVLLLIVIVLVVLVILLVEVLVEVFILIYLYKISVGLTKTTNIAQHIH